MTDAKINVKFLLGNEAIARGAIEANVDFVTGYPGTPSSEIIATLSKSHELELMDVEWATNEMAAFGNAMGASLAGKRSVITMKHAGMNWVADPLSVVVSSGIRAGMVIVAADDPGCHSSANEQDSRFYGQFFRIPVLEPATPQEAKDMTHQAFRLSEKVGLPVILRSVTRVSHCRARVILDEIADRSVIEALDPSNHDFYITGAKAIQGCQNLQARQKKLGELSTEFPYNCIEPGDSDKKVIITSGVAYSYVKDALLRLGAEAELIKLGLVNPLPYDFLADALDGRKDILVVEEGAPLLETGIKALLTDLGFTAKVKGKSTDHLPPVGELNVDLVIPAASDFLGVTPPEMGSKFNTKTNTAEEDLKRSMLFCAGCPHTGTMYSLKMAMKKLKVRPFIGGDIGCYTLMIYPPFQLGTSKFNMGSSISVASGYSRVTGEKTVAVIGDSTFIHAGIPNIVSAIYNQADMLLVICDNRTTAMTGGQPNAASGLTANGKITKALDLADLVEVLGAGRVRVVDPYDVKATVKAFEEGLTSPPGVDVIITKRECALTAAKERKRDPLKVDPETCVGCKKCMKRLGCSALEFADDKTIISQGQCTGCGVCAHVCPTGAIAF